MEQGTNEASVNAATEENVPFNQENEGLTQQTPRTLTAKDLEQRDFTAVAYSRALLESGDTLVIIRYPDDGQLCDASGFRLGGQTHRVHSDKLLATGSKKFQDMLSEWPQAKLKRRHGFFRGLPQGVKYILDLTPPYEGDEAVELISDLSCSSGIRHWYSAEERCNVPNDICGGKDEIVKPSQPKSMIKEHNDLAEALADPTFNPVVNLLLDHDRRAHATEIGSQPISSSSLGNCEDKELAEVMERSKLEYMNSRSVKARIESVAEVAEYCCIRHRAGIERLLQIIEGKTPCLNSAPKVWTLYVLAKYFDCTKVVVDFIVAWVLQDANCKFVEILPEITLEMGLGLKSAMLTRPAFAILVSEYALTTLSKERGAEVLDTNQFGRARETQHIDEDFVSAIQAAGYDFIARIENHVLELFDEKMPLFTKLPEFKKIARMLDWANEGHTDEANKKLINDIATKLISALSHFVRGRILWAFNRPIWDVDNIEVNGHRRAEAYLKEYESDFQRDIYAQMTDREKMMTRFPWKALKDTPFTESIYTDSQSNLLFNKTGVDQNVVKKNLEIAERFNVEPVVVFDLVRLGSKLNNQIMVAIQEYGFNFGRLSEECFVKPETSSSNVPESDYCWSSEIEDGPNAEPESIAQPPTIAQDRFQPAILHDMDLNSEPPAYSPPGRDFKEFLQLREQGNVLERVEGSKPSAVCIPNLLNLSFRPKDAEMMPLLEKRPNSDDPFSFGAEETASSTDLSNSTMSKPMTMLNYVSNMMNTSIQYTSIWHKPADPRVEAIDLHNQGSSTSIPRLLPQLRRRSIYSAEASAFPHPTTKVNEPSIPKDKNVSASAPTFAVSKFLAQAQNEIRKLADSLLNSGETDFAVLTDTLLCLTDEEWKYLPLWAGGNEDGSGGVFAPMVPPAPAGAGPSGPGPAFHTGYSTDSGPSTLVDFDGTSVDTSLDVDNGLSDHIDRRRIISDDGIASEAFTDDTEEYVGNGKRVAGRVYDQALDEVERSETPKPAEPSDDDFSELVSPEVSDDDEEFEGEDEEEAFDYGPEDHDDDEHAFTV